MGHIRWFVLQIAHLFQYSFEIQFIAGILVGHSSGYFSGSLYPQLCWVIPNIASLFSSNSNDSKAQLPLPIINTCSAVHSSLCIHLDFTSFLASHSLKTNSVCIDLLWRWMPYLTNLYSFCCWPSETSSYHTAIHCIQLVSYPLTLSINLSLLAQRVPRKKVVCIWLTVTSWLVVPMYLPP